jgi:probable rRNA maturation factor
VKITLNNFQKKVFLPKKKIKKLVLKVLKGEGVKKTGWINLCFVNQAQMIKFNQYFLKTKSATDVLAFDLSDKNNAQVILADIIISTQAALKQAVTFKTTPDYEISLYLVHGLLHILGFNDQTQSQIKQIRKKESQYVH